VEKSNQWKTRHISKGKRRIKERHRKGCKKAEKSSELKHYSN